MLLGDLTNPLIFVKQGEARQRKQSPCFANYAVSGKASVRCRTQVLTVSCVMPTSQPDRVGITTGLSSEQTVEEATDTLSKRVAAVIA